MTTPDAATEALAEAKAFVRRALKGKRSKEHVRRLAELVLKRRGYVIRKARKSE